MDDRILDDHLIGNDEISDDLKKSIAIGNLNNLISTVEVGYDGKILILSKSAPSGVSKAVYQNGFVREFLAENGIERDDWGSKYMMFEGREKLEKLANLGVEFPGSEHFVSKEKQWTRKV